MKFIPIYCHSTLKLQTYIRWTHQILEKDSHKHMNILSEGVFDFCTHHFNILYCSTSFVLDQPLTTTLKTSHTKYIQIKIA